MKRLRELEAQLVRLEGAALVLIVFLMLGLAGYNVIYRNVLVPLQVRWAHSGPVPEQLPSADGAEASEAPPKIEAKAKAPKPRKAKAAGGFGGAFGEGRGESGGEEDEFDDVDGGGEDAAEDAGDFGGAFGNGRPNELNGLDEPAADDQPKSDQAESDEGFRGAFGAAPDEEDEEDDFGEDGDADPDDEGESFGGAFGKPKDKPEAPEDGGPLDGEDEADDFGEDDVFDSLVEIEAVDAKDNEGPQGGPPPPGSFAANMVEFVDAVKLDWIDVLLRQLVIIMSFLGGALATSRRKHINVDAASKLLPAWAQRWAGIATNLLAISVCLTLANSGQKLVEIGRQYPKDITPFATDWMFQLMFPIGFGLLALHFGVRLLEELTGTAPPPHAEGAPPADAATKGEDASADASDADEAQGESSGGRSPDTAAHASADAKDEEPDEEPDDDPNENEGGSGEGEGDSASSKRDDAGGGADEGPDDDAEEAKEETR